MKPDHIPSQELTDETLCRLAASGDRVAEERLVMRYNRLVRMCARPYFLAGGDSEDLIQEGMVGLLAAIREYDSSKAAVFRTYAEVCIKNRLFSVIKAAARDKHTPLNNSVSFETPLFSGNGDRFAYHAPGRQVEDPEEIFLSRESFRERMETLMGQLSGFEASVLRLYLNGLSYSEIAAEVNKSPKSVDNAVQRIRRKVARQASFRRCQRKLNAILLTQHNRIIRTWATKQREGNIMYEDKTLSMQGVRPGVRVHRRRAGVLRRARLPERAPALQGLP